MVDIFEDNKAELADLLDNEPDCTCQQSDVDQFVSWGCEYHDQRSQWNRDVSRLQAATFRAAPEDVDYEYQSDTAACF